MMHRLAKMLVALVSIVPLIGWQDDVNLNLRNPYQQFSTKQGLGFFRRAEAQVRLGRYIMGSESHTWRGGAEGDVALVNWGDSILWHMGINMETLADDQNEINFRLVQVYYQALTGMKLKLGSGLLHVGYRHRCNHGTDSATKSRITIRSGVTSSYQWIMNIASLQLDVMPGFNLYVVGQNRDLASQPKGAAFVNAQAVWPIRAPVFMKIGAGAHFEAVSSGKKNLYFLADEFSHWRVEPLYGAKLAIRVAQELVTTDFGFNFMQNLDSGIGDSAIKSSAFSFDVDFLW